MRGIGVIIFLIAGVLGSVKTVAQDSDNFSTRPERADMIKSVHIFPNPAVEFVHVKFDQANVQHVTLTLHNIIGNEIQIETEVVDEHELKIRVKDLSVGYYLIAVRDNDTNFRGTYKFLKR